ncbi:hypothetical protein BAE44_0000126 [Dichanthelium oligosanthes]|uniref:Uncharacterized protein n=1 Tax=Dichanthelium oligosanthes TaxID=888268 RepID=A0A1E5WN76_9POAL|nr:hypothetical protein BAE44_0000126 [Dichanthelium oligosanthes]
MPTMTIPSAAIRRLRREGIEISRRRAALAPTGVVAAKKPSSSPPLYVLALPAPLPRSSPEPTTTSPPAPRRADGDDARLERARPMPSYAASPCSDQAAAPAAEPAELIESKSIAKGAQVRVRTRVGTARTGQPIVFWLRAVVDSAADDDGYLHVTYDYINGKLPRVARVAPTDIRLHDVPPADAGGTAASTGSSTVTGVRSACPPQQNKAVPRPTVAGKKLPLLKKFEEEMKSRSKAIIGH